MQGIPPLARRLSSASRRSRPPVRRHDFRTAQELRYLDCDCSEAAQSYGRQRDVEGALPAVNRIFGESVRPGTSGPDVWEVRLKLTPYNLLLQVGAWVARKGVGRRECLEGIQDNVIRQD